MIDNFTGEKKIIFKKLLLIHQIFFFEIVQQTRPILDITMNFQFLTS